MSPPYVVITACLNAGKTIGDTVRSVLSQTPPPRQYLIIDGGSQDDTLERVAEARRSLPSPAAVDVRVEPQRPLAPGAAGIPSAWNQALEAVAEPDPVIFILNADDWYEDGAAKTVLEAFAQHPEADIVACPVQYRAAPGGPVLGVQPLRSLRWIPFLMPVPHPGCFVRRQVYERLGRFSEQYVISADYDFVYRAVRGGCRFHGLGRPLVSMRPGGLARQRRRLARRETFLIARRHGAGLLRPGAAFLVRCLLNR